MATDFEFWQQNECASLGISKEKHDKIIAYCYQIGGDIGYTYDILTSLIYQEYMRRLSEQLQKIPDGLGIRQQPAPIDKSKCNCGKSKHPGRHHRRGCRLRQ